MKKPSNFHFQILTRPMASMRYKTIGDWFEFKPVTNQTILFSIESANTGNLDYNFLIALHELIEAYLCYKKGITTEQVDEWDNAHPDEAEPGMMQDCPYRHEHFIATTIEGTMARTLGINWDKYDKAINKTLKQYKK